MRLEQLHLSRYGRFTDTQIDFAAPAPGGLDMHIIFGPNEAGKSTLFSAWLDLLFGIPQQSRYSFLHAGPTMEIGASISHAGTRLDLVRRKGRGTTLYDTAGNGLPDSTLVAALGGLTRDGYSAMFSLDDETIEQGGEAILSNGGELGQLLFSASAGLSGLTRQLDALREEVDGFHRKGKRSGTLYDGKKQLEELARTARSLETTAAEQKRRSRELEDAQSTWREARLSEAKLRERLENVQSALGALPLERMLAEAKNALSQLGELPDASRADLEDLRALDLRKAKLDERNETLLRQIADLKRRIGLLPADAKLLRLESAINAAEALRAEHDSAVKDLPKRQNQLGESHQAIAALLADLGKADAAPTEIVLPTGLLVQLRSLLNDRSGLITTALAAADEVDKAQKLLETESSRLGSTASGFDPEQAARLAQLLSHLVIDDPGEKRRQAARERDGAAAKLRSALERLVPWRGDAEALAMLLVPAQARIDSWRNQLEGARQAEADALRDLRHHQQLLEGLRAGQDDEEETRIGFNLSDAAQARSDREALWAAHLASLSQESAKAFEVALRRDDQLTALMAEAIARRQRHDDAQIEHRELTHKVDLETRRHDAIRLTHQQLQAEITTSLEGIGFGAASLTDVELWLSLRTEALRLRDAYLDSEAALSRADEDFLQAARSLALALGKPGVAAADQFDLLRSEAEVLHRNVERHAEARNHLNRLAQDLRDREEKSEKADAALGQWKESWQLHCAGSILAALPYDSAQAGHLLDCLDELSRLTKEHADLAYRVAAMADNRDQFVAAKAAISVALDMNEAAPWTDVILRRDRGLAREAERQKLEAECSQREEDLRQSQTDLADHAVAIAALSARVTWSPAAGTTLKHHIEAAIEATRLRAEISSLAGQLQNRAPADDDTDRDEADLRDLAGELTVAVEEARIKCERLQGLASDAQYALDQIGGDDALARVISERENLRLSLEEQAREQLSRRFGMIALEIALRRFRESHQSTMLAQASQAFDRLSQGAYPSLSVVTQGNSDRLIALGSGGVSRMAADMSKGTRFQLYLALRIAGYHELAKSRPAVPFIADDIMETFDDNRASAAFELLGDMSRTGQVIYLTHHRHLCDIAQSACPGARVIDLASLRVTSQI